MFSKSEVRRRDHRLNLMATSMVMMGLDADDVGLGCCDRGGHDSLNGYGLGTRSRTMTLKQ